MGERLKFIEIIQSLEALVEEAYQEGWEDRGDTWINPDAAYSESLVKQQLNELKQEVE